jgi:serine/threonine protein kinase
MSDEKKTKKRKRQVPKKGFLHAYFAFGDIEGENVRTVAYKDQYCDVEYEILPRGTRGSFAEVRLARDLKTGREAVVKYPRSDKELTDRYSNEEISAIFLKEAVLLQSMDHPHIVKGYRRFYDEDETIHIPMERLVQSAEDFLMESPTMKRLYFMMKQAASGIAYLEKSEIVHCDFSTKNMMVDKKKQLKILDFGSANLVGQEIKELMSTPRYMPMVWPTGYATTSIDLHCFGISMAELLLEMNGFDQDKEITPLTSQLKQGNRDALQILTLEGVPIYLIDNIIIGCLESVNESSDFTSKRLEELIETFGVSQGFEPNEKSKNIITGEEKEQEPDY